MLYKDKEASIEYMNSLVFQHVKWTRIRKKLS